MAGSLSGLGVDQIPVFQGRPDFGTQMLEASVLSPAPQQIRHIHLFSVSAEQYCLLESKRRVT
jgi:hypothetical protein